MRRAMALAVATATLLALWGGTAQANPFPATLLADSSLHTYCLTAGFDVDPSVATYAMDVLDSTTDMTDASQACGAATDVWWWEDNLFGTTRGEWSCQTLVGADTCDSADISLDFPQIDVGINDWYDRRKTAVHEVGHSVGLGHDAISAMISGEVPSIALVWRRYSPHDLGHLNAQY